MLANSRRQTLAAAAISASNAIKRRFVSVNHAFASCKNPRRRDYLAAQAQIDGPHAAKKMRPLVMHLFLPVCMRVEANDRQNMAAEQATDERTRAHRRRRRRRRPSARPPARPLVVADFN